MALATISSTTSLIGSASTMNASSDTSAFRRALPGGDTAEPASTLAADSALGVPAELGPTARTTIARSGATDKSETENSPEPSGDFAVLLASLLALPTTSTVPPSPSPSAEVTPADSKTVSEAGAPVASGTGTRQADPESEAPMGRRPEELQAVEVEQQFAGLRPITASLFLPTATTPNDPSSPADTGMIQTSKTPVGEVLRTQSFDASTATGSPAPELSGTGSSSKNVSPRPVPTISTPGGGDVRPDEARGLTTNADRQPLPPPSPDHSTNPAAPSSSANLESTDTTDQPLQDASPAATSALSLTPVTTETTPTPVVRALTVLSTATRADDNDGETSPGDSEVATIGAPRAGSAPIPELRRDTRSSENNPRANIASAPPQPAKPSVERAELPPSDQDGPTVVPMGQAVASAAAGNSPTAAGRSPALVATGGVAAVSIASPRELADQLVTSAHRFRGVEGSHQMNLELNPADLGSVSIRLTVEGSTISMQMNAERAATGDLLRSSLAELRSSLSSGGFTTGTLSVGQHSLSNGAQTGQQSPHPDFARDSSASSTSTEGMDARSNSAAQRLRAVSNRTGGSHSSRLDVQL